MPIEFAIETNKYPVTGTAIVAVAANADELISQVVDRSSPVSPPNRLRISQDDARLLLSALDAARGSIVSIAKPIQLADGFMLTLRPNVKGFPPLKDVPFP